MKRLSLLFFPLLASVIVLAQTSNHKILPFGFIEEIQSKELSENRILNIYLPYGYHPDSAATYPVVYVLDGSAHEDFPHIAGLVQFMNMYDLMPKSIVVGIANVDRYRDFSHSTQNKHDLELLPTGGGSAAFIRFIKNELQPFITQHYKSNGSNTIIGQSMGGLVVTEILLKNPELFDEYIIVSPSLWWDDQSLVNSAAAFFQSHPELKKKIFVSLGTEDEVMHEVADKLVDAIRQAKNPNIKLIYQPILEETHATILHKAAYEAFEQFYEKPSKE